MSNNVSKYKEALSKIKVDDKLKSKTLKKILDKNLQKNNNPFKYAMLKLTTVLASLTIIFTATIINKNINLQNILAEKNDEIIKIEEVDILPKVGTLENLNKIISNMELEENIGNDLVNSESIMFDKNDLDYFKPNNQVSGVEEADMVKTDGEYIYFIENKKVYIVNATNQENLKIESSLEFENDIIPQEIFLNNNKLVVILDESEINEMYNENIMISYDIAYSDSKTIIEIYDLRVKESPRKERALEIEGRYISSRMVGDEVYVVTTKDLYKTEENIENIIPKYKDSFLDDEEHIVNVENMLYIPDNEDNNNFLSIVGFSLKEKNLANIKTIVGVGSLVYSTKDNLYIISGGYDVEDYTNIYKFQIEDTNIISKAYVKIKGRVLNQFSMGEYNNNFAIVTTEEIRKNNNINIKNNIFIFDENLNKIGDLENFAENESLYSVRFIKDKAYVVTFERVDPLFVIDLSIPEKIKILGELKVPGFSDYLQPYGENYLIGIGQDVKIENTSYGEREVIKGVKLSLFDVSDFNSPKEIDSFVLNEKSHTNVSYDYKSLLFLEDKNLIAFPVISYIDDEIISEYIILSIDIEKGFVLKEKINHGYVENEFGKYMVNIDRGIFISDYLYTISNEKIKINRLKDFVEINEINIS